MRKNMFNKSLKFSAILLLAFTFSLIYDIRIFADYDVDFIAGNDRYSTSRKSFNKFENLNGSSNEVILVNGNSFPDIISAISLSAQKHIPILYSNSSSIDSSTKNTIQNSNISNIYTIGEDASNVYLPGYNKIEYNGDDRYSTNIKVNRYSNSDKAIIVTGKNYPDAIAISSYSYMNEIPIFMVANSLNQEQKNILNDKSTIYIIGSSDSVSNDIENYFGSKAIRLEGLDRYDTNDRINSYFGLNDNSNMVVTNGYNFPDAFCASYIAGSLNRGITLLKNNDSRYLSEKITVVGKINAEIKNSLYINPHQDDELITMGLDLYRDINKSSKNVNFIQVTDGGGTSAITQVNKKLASIGKNTFTKQDIIRERNNELRRSLNALNYYGSVHYLNYENKKNYTTYDYNKTISDLTNDIKSFMNDNNIHPLNTELKTLANNNYDIGGSTEHKICYFAVKNIVKEMGSNRAFFSFPVISGVASPSYPVSAYNMSTDEIKAIDRAYREYDTWDPNNGKYAIAAHSMGMNYFYNLPKKKFISEEPYDLDF